VQVATEWLRPSSWPDQSDTPQASLDLDANCMVKPPISRTAISTVMSAIPVETAHVMQPADGSTPEIFTEFHSFLPGLELQCIERFAFYDLGQRSEVGLVIATDKARIYANIMLTIGLV
jgi:L-fucose mutarotase